MINHKQNTMTTQDLNLTEEEIISFYANVNINSDLERATFRTDNEGEWIVRRNNYGLSISYKANGGIETFDRNEKSIDADFEAEVAYFWINDIYEA